MPAMPANERWTAGLHPDRPKRTFGRLGLESAELDVVDA